MIVTPSTEIPKFPHFQVIEFIPPITHHGILLHPQQTILHVFHEQEEVDAFIEAYNMFPKERKNVVRTQYVQSYVVGDFSFDPPPSTFFCPSCESELEYGTAVCPACGNNIPDNADEDSAAASAGLDR